MTKEEEREPSEIYKVPRIYKKPEQEESLIEGFFDELIEQAKLVQDILTALGVMLEEIQENLELLLTESRKRIIKAV